MLPNWCSPGAASSSSGSSAGALYAGTTTLTLVTAQPANLGEYRAMIRNASSFNRTDTTPTLTPSAVNGFRIFATTYTAGGTSGNPNHFQIYIGLNKQMPILQPYQSAGRTGLFYMTPHFFNDSTDPVGCLFGYDPSTGVVMIEQFLTNNSTDVGSIGRNGGTGVCPSSAYFDVMFFT